MIRGLILVLTLAGPAMAEQPTLEVVQKCRDGGTDDVHQELKYYKPDTKAYNEASHHAWGDTYVKSYERCMLVNGFKFRSDIHCAVNVNPPNKLAQSSLIDDICYERIR